MLSIRCGPWYVPPGVVTDVGTRGTEGPARPPKSISSRPGCIPRFAPAPGMAPSSD